MPIYAGCYRLDPEPEPDQVLEATLAKDAIAKVLGGLPMHYRELLKLKHLEGFSLKEIGIRFWTQLGLDGPKDTHYMALLETEALLFARIALSEIGITSSKDLLPSG